MFSCCFFVSICFFKLVYSVQRRSVRNRPAWNTPPGSDDRFYLFSIIFLRAAGYQVIRFSFQVSCKCITKRFIFFYTHGRTPPCRWVGHILLHALFFFFYCFFIFFFFFHVRAGRSTSTRRRAIVM